MISNTWAWVLYIVVSVIVLAILFPSFRRFLFRAIVGPPNLQISELYDVFRASGAFVINRNTPRKLSEAYRSVQISSSTLSVIYHCRTGDGANEVVDIACPGKAGMILTLEGGRLRGFERIGGRGVVVDRVLTSEERRSLAIFMEKVREIVKEQEPVP